MGFGCGSRAQANELQIVPRLGCSPNYWLVVTDSFPASRMFPIQSVFCLPTTAAPSVSNLLANKQPGELILGLESLSEAHDSQWQSKPDSLGPSNVESLRLVLADCSSSSFGCEEG